MSHSNPSDDTNGQDAPQQVQAKAASHTEAPSGKFVPSNSVSRLWRLCRKELREILRDRRTIVTLVLMPLLVYPLLSMVFQRFLLTSAKPTGSVNLILGFEDEDARSLFDRLLIQGEYALQNSAGGSEAEQQKVSFSGIVVPDREALEKKIADAEIDLAIVFDPSESEIALPDFGKPISCTFLSRKSSAYGQTALEFVQQRLNALNDGYVQRRLLQLDLPNVLPLTLVQESVKSDLDSFSLTTLVPLILLLMTITGAVYPAIDLTAGERERGTLEVLMAAPVPRLSLLIAKYGAVVTVALLTAIANLFAMAITLGVSGLASVVFGPDGLSPLIFVQVLLLLVLFAAFFSAVLLAITSFARSFKEAQAYLIPIMLLSLAPGLMSVMPGIEFRGILVVTPLVNIVLLARDLLEGTLDWGAAAVAVSATALYSVAAISVAARVFGTDAILYGSQASWADMLRRPNKQRDVPSLPGVAASLAILFPLYFFVMSFSSRLGGLPLSQKLIVSGIATAVLFGVFPFVMARIQHLHVHSTFSLQPPPWLAMGPAVLLGFCLWPMAHELVLMASKLGFAVLTADQLKMASDQIAMFRQVSPFLILVALAITPAVCEELFFRGYVFNALRQATSVANAIFLSSILFGVFHVVATSGLALERLLPSTALGVALAVVRWRTGSIWPGILLHAIHNGLLLMLAYYRDDLMNHGWGVQEQEHLPWMWLVASVALTLIGFAWLCMFGSSGAKLSQDSVPQSP